MPGLPLVRTDRLLPCRLLDHEGIPSMIWFEDAIARFGVPTVLFKLYVLVSDPHDSAQKLAAHGWNRLPGPAKIGNAYVEHMTVLTLQPPPNTEPSDIHAIHESPHPPTTTILLSAHEWQFQLPQEPNRLWQIPTFYPTLPSFLDVLIDNLLDAPRGHPLKNHLSLQIAYLYDYAQGLDQRSFAGLLQPEHRQYHNDVLAGMSSISVRFQDHQRVIRDAIRAGHYELQDCSVPFEDERFFTKKRELELLLSIRPSAALDMLEKNAEPLHAEFA